MAPPIVPGEQRVDRLHHIAIAPRPGFEDGDTGRGVGNKDGDEAVTPAGGETGHLTGDIEYTA